MERRNGVVLVRDELLTDEVGSDARPAVTSTCAAADSSG
jgi:hypothetical protein